MRHEYKLMNHHLTTKTMKRLFLTYAFSFLVAITATFGQSVLESPVLNAGIGISGWGVPVYVGVDFPVHEAITVGFHLSYQTDNERFLGEGWKHTIIGISGRSDYHFNDLLDLPEEWDLYAGLSLGYYVWNTKYKGDFDINYGGTGAGGLGFTAQLGGRYFFTEKLAANLELGGGNVISGAKIGISILLK